MNKINWKVLMEVIKGTFLKMLLTLIYSIGLFVLYLGPFIVVILTGNWWFIFLYIISIYIYQVIENYFIEIDSKNSSEDI